MEIVYGGILALPGKGGLDSHSWWPTFLGVPAEYMESYYPLIIEEYSARRDSCGAGKFREGCGVRKVYRFLADGSIIFQDGRAHTYPYGGDGGKPGTPSAKALIWQSGEHQVALRGARRPVYEGDG
jgi:N-methylhydantoinase B